MRASGRRYTMPVSTRCPAAPHPLRLQSPMRLLLVVCQGLLFGRARLRPSRCGCFLTAEAVPPRQSQPALAITLKAGAGLSGRGFSRKPVSSNQIITLDELPGTYHNRPASESVDLFRNDLCGEAYLLRRVASTQAEANGAHRLLFTHPQRQQHMRGFNGACTARSPCRSGDATPV